MKKYIIWAPDYAKDGGIRVLHRFCHELIKLGHEAYLTAHRLNPEWHTQNLSPSEIEKLVKQNDVNLIYPEIVRGNPLGAVNVIRWVLQVPGMLNGDRVFAISEKVFVFLESYMPNGGYIGKLYLPTIELELFNTDNIGVRSGGCFWVHKGHRTPRIKETEGIPEIIGAWPATRAELAAFLKTREYLYSYDNCTALIDEARLCGCPVILIKDNYNEYNLDRMGDYMKLGVCSDIRNIEKARSELPAFQKLYMDRVEESKKQIINFIDITQ